MDNNVNPLGKIAVVVMALLFFYFFVAFLLVTPNPEPIAAKRKALRIAVSVAFALVSNLVVVQGYFLLNLGGVAPAGDIVGEQYYLGWGSRRVATSRSTFLFGAIHFLVSAPLAFFAPEVGRRLYQGLVHSWVLEADETGENETGER